jgi:hypothetical protein
MIDCLKCNYKFSFMCGHCVNGTIKTINNTIVQCTIRDHLLQGLFLGLTKMSYDVYLHTNPSTIYMIHELWVCNKVTLSEDNVVLHVG